MPRAYDAGSTVAAIGSPVDVAGFGLAGAVVLPAEDDDEARRAWQSLSDDIAVVILTEAAARAIGADRTGHAAPLTVVIPS
jgi:vacuolar-type H+-ATPase subunit F/Vma7